MANQNEFTTDQYADAHDQAHRDAAKRGEAPRKKFYERLAEEMIAAIEGGTAPWMQEWKPGEHDFPYNAATGNHYHGMNVVRLELQGRTDPRWMTRKQIEERGMSVRESELASGIVLAHYITRKWVNKLDDDGKPMRGEDGKLIKEEVRLDRPQPMYFVVYNGEQIEGIEPHRAEPRVVSQEELNESFERAEKLVANMGVPVKHKEMSGGESPHYTPHLDTIVMPNRDQYGELRGYYDTLLHEACHASGHESRLNRDELKNYGKSIKIRAVEELHAQIGSMLLSRTLDIGHFDHATNNTAYVRHWVQHLRDDPRAVLKACEVAEKIQKYVLAHEHVKERGEAPDKEALAAVPRGERQHEPIAVVPEGERQVAMARGLRPIATDRPLSERDAQAQVAVAKAHYTREERSINASLKAVHELTRKAAQQTISQAAYTKELPRGLRYNETTQQIIYPMIGANGKVATALINQAGKDDLSAKPIAGSRNVDCFCPFNGLSAFTAVGAKEAPQRVQPAVICGSAETAHALHKAGANVVLAVNHANMGAAAEALRAVRPDVQLVFALEKTGVREPKVPVQLDGTRFPAATSIRPPQGDRFEVADLEGNRQALMAGRGALKAERAKAPAPSRAPAAEREQAPEHERAKPTKKVTIDR